MCKFSSTNCGFSRRAVYGAAVSRRRQQGFSLVEVTLAIGVVAFAFVSLMALLPTGMNVFREAMDTSITAQIAQRVGTDLQETDFYTLLEAANLQAADPVVSDTPSYGVLPRRFFDDQGNEIVPQGGELNNHERRRVLYEVHIRLARDRKVLASGPEAEADIQRVGSYNHATAVIQIVNNPSGLELKLNDEQLIDQTEKKLPVLTYSALIARNGSEAR